MGSPLKARLYIGGLKSLFIDLAQMLEAIEKEGNMPVDTLETLDDAKQAIDLTLAQLRALKPRCCEHGQETPEAPDDAEKFDEEEGACGNCDGCDGACHGGGEPEDMDDDEMEEDDEDKDLPGISKRLANRFFQKKSLPLPPPKKSPPVKPPAKSKKK